MPKKPTLTKDKVPVWCLGWQEVLGLGDWDIEVNVVPHAELMERTNDSSVMGDCRTNTEHKWATIAAIDPDTDIHPSNRMKYDLEFTLLHEHLHICFDAMDRVTEDMVGMLGSESRTLMRRAYNNAQEQLINQLTKAFRSVKR